MIVHRKKEYSQPTIITIVQSWPPITYPPNVLGADPPTPTLPLEDAPLADIPPDVFKVQQSH